MYPFRRGRLPEAEAVALVLQVCEAMAAVHRANLFHRDIKPDNIMLCRDGRVMLIDFEAAREATGSSTRTVIVSDGYSPLEQYSPSGVLGAYSDVYALGATMYCLLVGFPPPPAHDREQKHVALVSLAGYGVSAGVERAVKWALELKASRRPQKLEAWMQALQPPAAPPPLPLSPKRNPSWATFVLGLLSAMTLVVFIGMGFKSCGQTGQVDYDASPVSVLSLNESVTFQTFYVTAGKLDIRTRSSLRAQVIQTLDREARVQDREIVPAMDSNSYCQWGRMELSDGRTGYISQSLRYVSQTPVATPSERVREVAFVE